MPKIKVFSDDVIAKIQTKHLTEFHKYLSAGDFLINKVKEMIFSGQSPVSGFGRYQKYSQSYVDQIEGKVRFFTFRGKAVPMYPKYITKISSKRHGSGEYSPLSFSRVASGRSAKSAKVEVMNRGGVRGRFEKPLPNKKKSPVNLYATGEMMNSMYLDKNITKKVIMLGFTDKKAKYHDKLGASKKKVIRRLLPTRQGEKFKPNINTALKQYCKQSLQQVLNDNRLALSIRFVFSTKR